MAPGLPIIPPPGIRDWDGHYRCEQLPAPGPRDQWPPCALCSAPFPENEGPWHGVSWSGTGGPMQYIGHYACVTAVKGVLEEDRRAIDGELRHAREAAQLATREAELAALDRAALLALLRRERARLNLASSDMVSTHGGYASVTVVSHDFGGSGTSVTRTHLRQALDRLGELLWGEDWEREALAMGVRLRLEQMDEPPTQWSPWAEGSVEESPQHRGLRLPPRTGRDVVPAPADDEDADAGAI